MALDGAYLHAVRQELLPLLDSRIEKIHQPTREELLVAFRGRTGGAKVLFSCAADRARVHLTQVAVENPKAPPMFCMLLRKRLGNGKLLAIRQDGLERVLYFDFAFFFKAASSSSTCPTTVFSVLCARSSAAFISDAACSPAAVSHTFF